MLTSQVWRVEIFRVPHAHVSGKNKFFDHGATRMRAHPFPLARERATSVFARFRGCVCWCLLSIFFLFIRVTPELYTAALGESIACIYDHNRLDCITDLQQM